MEKKIIKLSAKKISLLREFCEWTCEECHKHEKIVGTLQPHRLKRGNIGGKYDHRNIKLLCSKCHKRFHSDEPGIAGK